MSNIIKATLVSLAVLAGASAASAGTTAADNFDLDRYLQEQQLNGGA